MLVIVYTVAHGLLWSLYMYVKYIVLKRIVKDVGYSVFVVLDIYTDGIQRKLVHTNFWYVQYKLEATSVVHAYFTGNN